MKERSSNRRRWRQSAREDGEERGGVMKTGRAGGLVEIGRGMVWDAGRREGRGDEGKGGRGRGVEGGSGTPVRHRDR